MSTMKKKITKTLIDDTKAPEKGEITIWDTELPSFGVRVQPGGRKVYLVRYRTKDGKNTPRKMTIGRCADMPPDKARNRARDIFASVAAGNDPAAERKVEERDANVTVEAMFKARVNAMKKKGRAMADEVERVLLLAQNNAADSIGRKRHPAEVTVAHIIKFVASFYDAGHPGAADKARSYLNATFEWAIKSANDYTIPKEDRHDWGLTQNPVASVAKDTEAGTARDRHLSAAEMRIFWRACSNGNAGFTEGTEICLKTIMACGQRVMETLRLDGADLDLDELLWTMPPHKTKGQEKEHKIPLPAVIVPYLRMLKEKHGDGPLFPAVHASSVSGVLTNLALAHAVRRYVTAPGAEIAPFQPRDLRRTWKSRCGDGAKVDRFTRDLIQQHAKTDTGSIHYDWADYLPPMRKAMDDWSNWLEANVINPPTPPEQHAPLPELQMAA